jgi:hypothetical protein
MFLIPKSLGSPSIPKYHLEGLAQFTREEIENVPEWAALNSFPEELSQFTDEEQKIVPGWAAQVQVQRSPRKVKRK